MKRKYQQPTMNVVRIQQAQMLCDSVKDVNGNADLGFGGGANGVARSRSNGGWDDDEE